MIKINSDKVVAVYVKCEPTPAKMWQNKICDFVIVDYDENGNTIGVEILYPMEITIDEL